VTRLAAGKGTGFAIGLAGFVSLPWIWPDADPLLRWGILLWYTTFGAIVGFAGVFDRHPMLRVPLKWWLRGPLLGAWLNFVLVFFAHDAMAAMLASVFGAGSVLDSPWWFALEGALVGLLIDGLATRYGGEGSATSAAIDGRPPAA
jgi:hypothetical protein